MEIVVNDTNIFIDLLKILQSPTKHRPDDLRIIPSEVIDGYWIQRGNEYLIPLIFLYSALALRLNKKVFTPDVVLLRVFLPMRVVFPSMRLLSLLTMQI